MKDTVLITGASGGLGLELARCFAQNGYDLILTARSEQRLLDIQKEMEQCFRVQVTAIPMDLGEKDAAKALMATIIERGLTVDILINNAGFGDFGVFADCRFEKQEAMVQLNVMALIQLTHLVLPAMLAKKRGRILNVASIAAFQPGPYMSIYYSTKAFVLSFSQAIARELKGSGITVTALCPGPIKTGFEQAAKLDDSKLFESLPVATAEQVAAYGYKALMRGKTVAVHGLHCKLMIFFERLVPRALITNIICKIQGVQTKP